MKIPTLMELQLKLYIPYMNKILQIRSLHKLLKKIKILTFNQLHAIAQMLKKMLPRKTTQGEYVKTLKMIQKMIKASILALSLAILTGCAAGAATAGYSIKAQSADSLTASAEQKIVERTKQEIFSELSRQQQLSNPSN